MLRENDVKDTAYLIFLMMMDQKTQDSFGTFHAWIQVECPGIRLMGVNNMWRYAHEKTGQPYPDGTYF